MRDSYVRPGETIIESMRFSRAPPPARAQARAEQIQPQTPDGCSEALVAGRPCPTPGRPAAINCQGWRWIVAAGCHQLVASVMMGAAPGI